VRAGKIDEAALQQKLDALGAEHQKDPAKISAAFQTLHDTLTAEQRGKLVAAVRDRMAEREQRGAERHARDSADRQAPEGADSHPRRQGADDEARGPKGPRPFAPWLHGIELTDAQRAQIEQALKDAGMGRPEGKTDGQPDGKPRFEAMRTKWQAALDAFASDRFDAAAFVPTKVEGPRGHADKLVKVLAAVTPVLDQAQRATLADNLEKGPMAKGKHRGPRPTDEPVDEEQ
jgi:Spy/CpxP family protein refolding chaperone